MTEYNPSNLALIGAGGDAPRVDIINPQTGDVKKRIQLPSLHSVYAIDLEATGAFAFGTRCGMLFLQDEGWETINDTPRDFREFFQGAAILSVCSCNDSYLAASDAAGRCLLWHKQMEHPPIPLKTEDGVICSLICLPNNQLAGCSSEGKLMFWQIPEGAMVRVMDISRPPSVSSLIQMVYWHSKQTLVCPGTAGLLNLCDLRKSDIRNVEAHQGDVYAVSLWDEALVTLGMEDGRLKVWENAQDNPTKDICGPKGIISMAVSGYRPVKMLVLSATGKAAVYTQEQDHLQLVAQVDGKDYRIIAAHGSAAITFFEHQQRQKSAEEVLHIIQTKMDRGFGAVMEEEHAKLIDLGYQHVSLAIKADQAVRNENLSKAIELYAELMRYLPQNHPASFPSMEKYAELLEKTWHITEAKTLYECMLKTDPKHPVSEKHHSLRSIEKIMTENAWVIEPGIPIDAIIESNIRLEKRFKGRYVLRKLSAKSCRGACFDPEMIALKYDQIRNENGNGNMPAADIKHLWWISKGGVKEIDLVVIGDGEADSAHPFQYALQVFCDTLNTLIAPVILFHWQHDPDNISAQERNQMALDKLERAKSDDLENTYLTTVHKGVNHALRRMMTETISKR